MKLKQWAKKQGITYRTAWSWFKNGTMPVEAYKTETGTIIVKEDEKKVDKLKINTYTYSRVSSNNKKDDLKRQKERIRDFCLKNGWSIEKEISEVASGLNDKRPKLIKMIKDRPSRIVVEHKDRLTRFGFNYFDELLPLLGIELIVMNRDVEEENDLIKDLVAIITSFCCRLYGARRGNIKSSKIKNLLNDSSEINE